MQPALKKCEVIFDVPGRQKALDELEKQMAAPDFWNDQNKARSIIDQANQNRLILNPFKEIISHLSDCSLLLELAESEKDENQRLHTIAEVEQNLEELEKEYKKSEFESLFDGRMDSHNAYLSLHAGAGGNEACDWVAMLLRMYRRYCENRGFEVSIMDMMPGDEAGFKSVTLMVTGCYVYGYLAPERGVHRLVRISPFDANRRRHTSFASMDVIAEIAEDVDVEINEGDLRVDTFRACGAGGQHVNKTDSAVRLTHLETGIVVACQSERSQHANKNKAMRLLRSRLYEYKQDQKRQEMEKFYGEKGDIAWGRQIRSYVLQPYTMAKDHRTGVEYGNVMDVLEGNLDPFILPYIKFKRNSRKPAVMEPAKE